MITLSELTIYPVKSMAGLAVDSISVDRFGLKNDRRWMLVDTNGRFLSQRELPKMALLQVSLIERGICITLDGEKIELNNPNDSAEVSVDIWRDNVSAVDAGDAAAQWLKTRLNVDCRIVYMPEHGQRLVDTVYASNNETVGFADGFPLLLISQSSLDDLNGRLSTPVPMNRFRPNLVVTGCDAFAEDKWQKIRIGNLELEIVKPCARCVMPSVDQQTAEKDSSILRVLASYRRKEDRQIYFGQNLLYQTFGQLTVGQQLEVIS